jgi:hypothetical protein
MFRIEEYTLIDAMKAVILIFTAKRPSNLTGYDCQTLKITAEKIILVGSFHTILWKDLKCLCQLNIPRLLM